MDVRGYVVGGGDGIAIVSLLDGVRSSTSAVCPAVVEWDGSSETCGFQNEMDEIWI